MSAGRRTAAFFLLGGLIVSAGCRGPAGFDGTVKGTLSLSGAWALYPMAVKWAEEFRKIQPGVRIDVQAGGAGKGMADALAGMADFGMVSREVHPEEAAKGALAFAVAKDAVVATVSSRNPHLAEILRRGVIRERFVGIWISGSVKTWGEAIGLEGEAAASPIHVFTRSDACGAADTWAAFLGKHQEDLGGVGVYGDPGLADAVKRDPLAVGFNNINFAYDPRTLRPIEGLAVVPIDLDGSGVVEPAEATYATRDDITGAILRKVYPSPPARDLYLVSRGRPAAGAAAEFLRWVLSEGQRFVPETGFIPVGAEQLKDGLAKLK
jgi:phosphate transport system substrate-binding protein